MRDSEEAEGICGLVVLVCLVVFGIGYGIYCCFRVPEPKVVSLPVAAVTPEVDPRSQKVTKVMSGEFENWLAKNRARIVSITFVGQADGHYIIVTEGGPEEKTK